MTSICGNDQEKAGRTRAQPSGKAFLNMFHALGSVPAPWGAHGVGKEKDWTRKRRWDEQIETHRWGAWFWSFPTDIKGPHFHSQRHYSNLQWHLFRLGLQREMLSKKGQNKNISFKIIKVCYFLSAQLSSDLLCLIYIIFLVWYSIKNTHIPFTNIDLISKTQILVIKHIQPADFTQREAKVRRD